MEVRNQTQEPSIREPQGLSSLTVEGGRHTRNPVLPDVLGKVPGAFLNSQTSGLPWARWLPVFTYSSVFGGSLVVYMAV